jgi:CelD/BcsL family acetyltransferase involved in cellulose biosynthesis
MRTPAIRSRVLSTSNELFRLSHEWHVLWTRCPGASTFQRPEWLLAWAAAFLPHGVRAIEFRRDSELVGLAPLLIYPREHEQVLAFMGGGVSDYLDLLAHPSWEQEIVGAFREVILRQPDWTLLDLTDLPGESVLLKDAFRNFVQPHDTCLALELPATTDELLQLLSKRQRANLRNARSRLQSAGGGEVQLASAATLADFLQDLFRLHTERWSKLGAPGVLSDERIQFFHSDLAPRLLDCGCLRIYRLVSSGRTLAVIEAFFEAETAFCYMQGFDPEFSYLSPGTQLMFAIMNEAVRAGVRKFDFLRGQESYKAHWHTQPERTLRITVSRSQLASISRQAAA